MTKRNFSEMKNCSASPRRSLRIAARAALPQPESLSTTTPPKKRGRPPKRGRGRPRKDKCNMTEGKKLFFEF
ncbi:4129_t:CDS:2 [Diversispora eburnea]|uniref:4129_t:CDS:1 n=1 Tax=Diversispora eburnea TaxID=1213867 RepID=A0A9N9FIF5_9GLOM|nr:4129_t:CDS:2 [Diversispora eburnea]